MTTKLEDINGSGENLEKDENLSEGDDSTKNDKIKKKDKAKIIKSKVSVFEIPPHFPSATLENYQLNPSNFEIVNYNKKKKQDKQDR